MKIPSFLVLFCLVALCGSPLRSAWSESAEYRKPFSLPDCPSGSRIVLYGPLPKGVLGLNAEKVSDWKSFLIERGIKFPKDGFALFYPPGRMLAVATDEKNQELLRILFE